MSHHIHNILLFRVKFGLEVEGLGFPGSQYALFLTMLLYVIHFLSPVIIRFKKGSILFRASRDVHMITRSSKFFWLNSCSTHLEYFHTNPIFRIWSEMVYWAEFLWSPMLSEKNQHCFNNIVVDQRWSLRTWLIRKVEITYFKFFVPSSMSYQKLYLYIYIRLEKMFLLFLTIKFKYIYQFKQNFIN